MNNPHTKNSLSLSLSRKRKLILRKTLLLTTLTIITTAIITPPIVSSVQNIFFNFGQITDIQIGGDKIDLVLFEGQILWERAQDASPLSELTYLQDLALPENSTACTDTTVDINGYSERVTLIDRRNDQPYYVQKIGNLCWMETNLRYAGDGNYDPAWNYPDDRYATTTTNNTANPNDNTRPLSTTTSGWLGGSTTTQFQQAGYFDPNGSTDYTNTTANGGFYGYLYNWCSAMGGQPNACNNTSTTGFDTTTSICPAGWRLPTGNTGGEFQALNTATNGGATNTDAGLRNNFLAVYSGNRANGLANQGAQGYYWSSNGGTSDTNAYNLRFSAGNVIATTLRIIKNTGSAVRCVL